MTRIVEMITTVQEINASDYSVAPELQESIGYFVDAYNESDLVPSWKDEITLMQQLFEAAGHPPVHRSYSGSLSVALHSSPDHYLAVGYVTGAWGATLMGVVEESYNWTTDIDAGAGNTVEAFKVILNSVIPRAETVAQRLYEAKQVSEMSVS